MSDFDKNRTKNIRGISVCNPVELEEEYVNYTVDYAIRKGYNHIQFIGPIHNPVKGNIDGMAFYQKYSMFNNEKDSEYVEKSIRIINKVCEKTYAAGIKTYVWHHELELPHGFKQAFPQTLNENEDIEVSSPEVEDFLRYKIIDFFAQYPKINGIILTLHETKVPLLKLKNQKLDKMERVKFVTKILYDTCHELGKELIVRPFASVEEDYAMMMQAYEDVSTEMIVMDKWTQFDWSLCLPDNAFYAKIDKNPLLVETDIFGEFFGKGRLPLMLKNHIIQKYAYCEQYGPQGYCSRIDRNGEQPFGSVNEVNLEIMHACLQGEDVECAIGQFFVDKYGDEAENVRLLMEPTEDILKKIIYLKGLYFSELSMFPKLNHCKNHFYFEIMKENYAIASDEWFVPKGWERGTLESVLSEKKEAVELSEQLYTQVLALSSRMDKEQYESLHIKFLNLKLCASIWEKLVHVFLSYTRYFETQECKYEEEFKGLLNELLEFHRIGTDELGEKFYCCLGDNMESSSNFEYIPFFVKEIRESFEAEKRAFEAIGEKKELYDYIVCGGGVEGHKLQKEVNYSDTLTFNGKMCRIPGNSKGMEWSTINGHGWFSYALKLRPNAQNRIQIYCGSMGNNLDMQITLGNEVTVIKEEVSGDKIVELSYLAGNDENEVRIRFDRITGYTPCIYAIEVTSA